MARTRLFKTFKARLTVTVLVCFICVGVPSLTILFSYMNSLVAEQVGRVNRNWVDNAADEVNGTLDALVEAVSWTCFNENVRSVMRMTEPLSSNQMLELFRAQDSVSTYLAGSPVWTHLNKVIVFNRDGVFFEYVKNRSGTLEDLDLVGLMEDFESIDYVTGSSVRLRLGRTLNSPYEDAVLAFGRMRDPDAYVYAELSMSVFDPLRGEGAVPELFIESEEDASPVMPLTGEVPEHGGGQWIRHIHQLSIPGLVLVHYENRWPVSISSAYGLGTFITLLLSSIILVYIVSVFTSRLVTRPANALVRHIQNLSESASYGTVDPSLEEGGDEIAEIGRTVNRMSLSIASLLESNDRLNEEKRRTELAMLQMQVNPHFLYNTLESIHYLARIQKADGIASMSRGLSHLLKNMAKGDEMITLSDELELVREYDDIQQVRYMGMYEIVYDVPQELLGQKIQKFTLQPLIENAIFHGIEPGGRDGTIRVSACLDGDFLLVTVTDDGVGMDAQTLAHVFDEKEHFKGNMTGVGVRNINERIRLCYGPGCGLSFTSEPGRGTTATVRITASQESGKCTEST